MHVSMLRTKLHRATVTEANLHYEGSISICPKLLEASGLLLHEQVDVLNITNGQRFTTYIIEGGPGEICLNGAAARLAVPGDQVIVIAYSTLPLEEARRYEPTVVLVDEQNRARSK